MSNQNIRTWLTCLVVLAGVSWTPTRAQDGFPPEVYVIAWDVLNFTTGELTTVFDLGLGIGSLNAISNFQHFEYDTVFVTIRMADRDWDIAKADAEADPDNTDRPDYEEVYRGVRVFSAFTFFNFDTFEFELTDISPPFGPPVLPIFPFELGATLGPTTQNGFQPNVNDFPNTPGRPFVDTVVIFQLPRLVGPRQTRLQGEAQDPNFLGFDARYLFEAIVSEEQTNDLLSLDPFISTLIPFGVIVNPDLASPSTPPFADASAPTRVESNTTVTLDARRTFDAGNIGFDQFQPPSRNNVYLRDNLAFVWEWVSGPVRVDPVHASQADPIARVTLVEPGTYRYRVIVSDQAGSPPSAAAVEIEVVESIPRNRPPIISVVGSDEPVPVGDVITLDARGSFDPDGDSLNFRWRQANAFGEPLTPDEIRRAFQPLSGLDDAVSTWQAVAPGRYYFVLLVDDGAATQSELIRVDVVASQTQGASAESGDLTNGTASNADDAPGVTAVAPIGLCGAGLLPWMAAPLLLLAGRRRR